MSSSKTTPSNATPRREFDGKQFAKNMIATLGSLRITVFLLALGLIMILIATLQQTRRDIHQVKQQHFRAPVVYVTFQEMLIPAWFPEIQEVGGGFLMPSGVSVLVAMLLNLFFAHLLRFRIQASGKRLLWGTMVLLAGVAATLAVIMYGNQAGFQDTPLIEWESQWEIFKYLMLAAGLAGLIGAWTLVSNVRRTFSFAAGFGLTLMAGLLIWKGQAMYVGDDAMRVVWRLMQGGVAATVCYIGAVLVFRRKAGIALIHTGLLLLMIGELYTTYAATEQRMFFFEGESSSFTFNVDNVEMAVITAAAKSATDDSNKEIADPENTARENVVAIPVSQLAIDGFVDTEQLPFKIRTLIYYQNANRIQKSPNEPSIPGEKGIARYYTVTEATPVTGTDMGEINMAAAYVQLQRKDNNEDLGTFLISQSLYQDNDFDLDSVTVDGREYKFGLRFKHYYKPYTVQLNSTKRTNYTGTITPQTYSSNFRIIDSERGIDEIKDVSMNQPLRLNNETFYQSGHDTDPTSGRSWSVLQIVQNTGWMIPYVCCAMVGIGLVMHFLGTFLRFVERLTTNRETTLGYDMISWVLVIGCVLMFAMASKRFIEKPATLDDMNLAKFGQMPVAWGGRVQPLDSLARSTLRRLRKYEIPVRYETNEDGEKEEVKYPPIQWLADWIFDAPDCDKYRIFKVDNPEVISSLSLVRRKSHLFSVAEIEAASVQLEKYSKLARALANRDESKLSNFQKKIIKLDNDFELVKVIRYAFADPTSFFENNPIRTLETLSALRAGVNIPLAMPEQEPGKWSAASLTMAPGWIKILCDRLQTRSVAEVAIKITDERWGEQTREQVFRRELARQLLNFGAINPNELSPEQLNLLVEQMIEDPDQELQEKLSGIRQDLAQRIDAETNFRLESMAVEIGRELEKHAPVSDGQFEVDNLAAAPPISELAVAYLARDAATFNGTLDRHLEHVSSSEEVTQAQNKIEWEHRYNRISPFYIATAIYIGSLLLGFLSWLLLVGAQPSSSQQAWANGARRAAFWLVLFAFLFHTAGLLMRIYISGRPPVTNLYSSAVFIGWIGVLIGVVTERIIGFSFGSIISSVVGVLTLLASFALGADGDTFSVLQAVLDTQFWLSTHVVSITIGYSTTLAAGALGMLYLATSMLAPYELKETRQTLAKMVYGVTCLALIFSFVGTVLGGLWADDSWGRFWGWDVKENGALMIVMINAILLHARWAGLVRERGMAMLAIFGNIVTLWSWFAVNELGVGLHTYGLTEGRMQTVGLFWLIHLGFIVAALIPTKYWLSNLAARRNS